MIDFHSHILPAMDDGSRSVTESLALLQQLKEQGVDTVVATPHFYANHESVEDFLRHREKALAALKKELPKDAPRILCGAEVRYYPGISRLQDIRKLCVEGSRLLLLEMPSAKWTEYTVGELTTLAGMSRLRLALAHVERCLPLQKGRMAEYLRANGILLQCNAEYFLSARTKRRAIAHLREGSIHMIGSDCHDLTNRPPEIGKAFERISKKLGQDFLLRVCEYGETLLDTN